MSKVVHPKTRLARIPINDGRQTHLLPAFQHLARVGQDTYIEIDLRPNASVNAMSNGDDILYDLEYNDAFNVKNPIIKLRMRATGDVQTVPAPYYFKRIRTIANKGSGDDLQSIYPEQIVLNYMMMRKEERDYYQRNGMIKFIDLGTEYRLSEPEEFKNGDVRDVYIQLPLSFWDMDSIQLQHMKEDIRIRMELDDDFVISGSATDIKLDAVSLLIRQDELSDVENHEWVKDNQRQSHIYNYLDVTRVNENTKTLTSGSENKYDLQSIVGKAPFLIVVHKPSANPQASDKSKFTYLDIGDDGLFDLKSPNNQSLLGKGNAIRGDRIKQIWTGFFRSKPLQGFYIIPFCHDVEKSYTGVVDNYFEFVGDKETLSVEYGSSGTAEVHSITLNNPANDGGYYKLSVNGYATNSLVYNETPANIKSALEALKPIKENGYTVTVSGTAEASFTITFDQYKDGRVSNQIDPVQLIVESLNDGGVDEFSSSAVSTYGSKGWETSSARTTEVHAHYYKRLFVRPNGRLSCKTL